MKATLAAATAALVGGTTAASLHHRHEAFHGLMKKNPPSNATEACGCTTIYSTYYGEPTLVFPPAPPPPAPTSEYPVEAPPAPTEGSGWAQR